MRAVRFQRGQAVLDRAAPEPAGALAAGEVLIRPTRAALHPSLRHPDPSEGRVLGGAFVGIVVSSPGGSTSPGGGAGAPAERPRVAKGKRVIAHAAIACRTCDLCKGGLGQHCRARQVIGRSRDGPLADLIALPASALISVPEALDDDRAALVHAVAGAHHAATLVRLEGKTYVTVLGDTLQALLVAQLMAARNASVRVLGERPVRFGLAERWSVRHRHVGEAGRRRDQDIVVDCTGSPAGLAIAAGMVRPRGRIILPVAPPPPPASLVDLRPIVENEVELLGCTGYGGTLEPALDLLARRAVHVEPLIAGRLPLERAAEALNAGEPDLDSMLVEFGE